MRYVVKDDEMYHIGTPRHSGRYPWGSGENPEQRNTSFLGRVAQLKKQGLSEKEIATAEGLTINQLRAKKTIEISNEFNVKSAEAQKLKDKGMSNTAIAKAMDVNDHTVARYLDPVAKERANKTMAIANSLRKMVDDKKYLDVGLGTENHMNVSRTQLKAAISVLEAEGYKQHYVRKTQMGTGKQTSYVVLAPPGVPWKEVNQNYDKIATVTDYFPNNGTNKPESLKPPQNISSSRVFIRYRDDGGLAKDGLIEIRRNADDLSLGASNYSQVRIAVDGDKYMKGMAVYSDDIPKGYDVIYNTNKTPENQAKVFKKQEKGDPLDPFGMGSSYYQRNYVDSSGQEKLSALNIVNEQGDWAEWHKSISSQVLSKQPLSLAKKQLGEALEFKKLEYDELNSLTNPAVKKRLLQSFADDADSAAVHLKAAALPRQSSHVILPIPSMKENQVFAPGFKDGESVVLIRHPHGGRFEIPELTVNNRNPDAIKTIGRDSRDAVGIHPTVAAKLSGADFDGDTVIVIPNDKGYIKTRPAMETLINFDPKESYKLPDSAPKMLPKTKQTQMGVASNLITDMTIGGADWDKIARAVKYSMVVIDAEKHHLDYKRAAIDFGIPALKKEYQGGEKSGAATLVSRAGSQERVLHRKDQAKIDRNTGEKIYSYYTNEKIINKKGHEVQKTVDSLAEAKALGGETYVKDVKKLKDKVTGKNVIDPVTNKPVYVQTKPKIIQRMSLSTKMAEAKNAYDLSSGTMMEAIYADHANALKTLANTARKNIVDTKDIEYSPSANKTYHKEVESLKSALNIAYMNKPYERKAQLIANKQIATKLESNPQIDADDLKKLKGKELIKAREAVGAKKDPIQITDREWEAIQAGAIHNNTLTNILLNTDVDALKERAMPRTSKAMSPDKISKARAMLANDCTLGEVAEALGVSTSTLDRALA
jgi:predicted transcriptional regulator